MGSSQLSKLCFPKTSYETARKRLRRLQQAGLTGFASSERMEGRGRPELIYFLTAAGARVLEQNYGIMTKSISTGPAHAYQREYCLRLADLHLAFKDAEDKKLLADLHFMTGREFCQELLANKTNNRMQADAKVSFRFSKAEPMTVLLKIDTGNLRQTRHWEPQIRAFLKADCQIWVIADKVQRITLLRKWTQPLLLEAGLAPDRCIFGLYNEIMEHGICRTSWQRADGSTTSLFLHQTFSVMTS
jgi:DNA-binding PadR family transcriptional regulator